MVQKNKSGCVIFVLGTLGALSMHTAQLPIEDLPRANTERFTPQEMHQLAFYLAVFTEKKDWKQLSQRICLLT
jgi:hypothetical protein